MGWREEKESEGVVEECRGGRKGGSKEEVKGGRGVRGGEEGSSRERELLVRPGRGKSGEGGGRREGEGEARGGTDIVTCFCCSLPPSK